MFGYLLVIFKKLTKYKHRITSLSLLHKDSETGKMYRIIVVRGPYNDTNLKYYPFSGIIYCCGHLFKNVAQTAEFLDSDFLKLHTAIFIWLKCFANGRFTIRKLSKKFCD